MLSGFPLGVLPRSILLERLLKRILSGVVRMVEYHAEHSSKVKKHEDNHVCVLNRDRDTLYLICGALLFLTEGTAGQEAAFHSRTLVWVGGSPSGDQVFALLGESHMICDTYIEFFWESRKTGAKIKFLSAPARDASRSVIQSFWASWFPFNDKVLCDAAEERWKQRLDRFLSCSQA